MVTTDNAKEKLNKTVCSQLGFTLVELLVAIVILLIGVVSLNLLQIRAIKGNSTAQRISTAAIEVSDQIEQIMRQDFSALSAGSYSSGDISWVITDWHSDNIDNDQDGRTDELDESGVYQITMTLDKLHGSPTVVFIKTEIY